MLTFLFWYGTGVVASLLTLKLLFIIDTEAVADEETYKFTLWMLFMSWIGTIIILIALIVIKFMDIFSKDSKFFQWLVKGRNKKE